MNKQEKQIERIVGHFSHLLGSDDMRRLKGMITDHCIELQDEINLLRESINNSFDGELKTAIQEVIRLVNE